ncbi:hypothetical protein BGZ83_004998 [Gryganskiella cystojenkinii]|nr:hypothetical protein BGZ83_004998 [Gryganskiella cystojenkinii]
MLSHLLLAQPLTIYQGQSPSPSFSDVILTPLRPPRTPSHHLVETSSVDSISDFGSSVRTSLDQSLHDNIDEQDLSVNHSNIQYQPPHFDALDQHATFLGVSSMDHTQVFPSLDDVAVDQSFERSPIPGLAESESGTAPSTMVANADTFSETSPLLPPTHPYTMSGQTLSLSVDNLVMLPRGAIPRRRYATRDYSTGSISSDDWLRHPDVIALNNASTDGAPQECLLDDSVQDDILTDRNTTIAPAAGQSTVMDSTPDQNLSVLAPRLDTPLDESLSLSLFSQPLPSDETVQDLEDMDMLSDRVEEMSMHSSMLESNQGNILQGRLPDTVLNTGTAVPITELNEVESPPTANSTLTDRLGLLGPLLADSQTVLPLAEEPLEFSLLGSNRPGFDSSILSMTSRIRQARLTRLLRLLSERDSSLGYAADRQPWNRAHPADTRSMINHTGGSRGTSLAGSLDDGPLEVGLETDSLEAAEDSRASVRSRDAPQPLQFYPVQCPTFTEILDCNGNPIESSSSESYGSSSASSFTSQGNLEELDEDPEWFGSREQRRRRRRTTQDRNRWNGGDVIRGHGRSRVVSSGTVFEGVEHISEADSLLMDNHRYQSLKASWVTNPNGESWSDDDIDEPNRTRNPLDSEDKDLETVSLRRGQPSLGTLQPQQPLHQQGSQGGLYYIYGNVRNRYGPDQTRRRRVMTEMSDLLRREREWERELEQYGQEMAAFHSGIAAHLAATRPTTAAHDSNLILESRYANKVMVIAAALCRDLSRDFEIISKVFLNTIPKAR